MKGKRDGMRFSATNYEEEKDVGSSRYDESTGFHTCSYNIKEAFTTKLWEMMMGNWS